MLVCSLHVIHFATVCTVGDVGSGPAQKTMNGRGDDNLMVNVSTYACICYLKALESASVSQYLTRNTDAGLTFVTSIYQCCRVVETASVYAGVIFAANMSNKR